MRGHDNRLEAVLTIAVCVLGAIAFLVLTSGSAHAAGCHNRFAVQKVAAVQQVCHVPAVQKVVVEKQVQPYYPPPVQNHFYAVGQPMVQQAQMAQAVRDVLSEYRFQAELSGSITGSVQGGTQGYAAPAYQPPAQPQPPRFNFSAPQQSNHCTHCHTGPDAKGQFSLEHATQEQLRSAYARLREGTMPPGGALSPEQQLEAIDEVFGR